MIIYKYLISKNIHVVHQEIADELVTVQHNLRLLAS